MAPPATAAARLPGWLAHRLWSAPAAHLSTSPLDACCGAPRTPRSAPTPSRPTASCASGASERRRRRQHSCATAAGLSEEGGGDGGICRLACPLPLPPPLPTRVQREQRDDGRHGACLDDGAGKRLVLPMGEGASRCVSEHARGPVLSPALRPHLGQGREGTRRLLDRCRALPLHTTRQQHQQR